LAVGLIVTLLLLAALLFYEQARLEAAITNARAANSAYQYSQLERDLLKAALLCKRGGITRVRENNLVQRARLAIESYSFPFLAEPSRNTLELLLEHLEREPARTWPCARLEAWADQVHPVVIEATEVSSTVRSNLLVQLRTYRRDTIAGFVLVLLFALAYLYTQAREVLGQRRRIADLESEGAFKTRLLGMVAHELRTPIATIVGFSELLGRAGDDRENHLARIQSAAARLGQTLAAFLDLYRLESGQRLELARRPVELRPLLEEAAAMLQVQYPDRFRIEPGDDARVEGDEGRLFSTVLNLLTNAAKYGRESDPVRVRLTCREGTARVEVEDGGPPLSPEEAEAIFQPWTRLPRHRGHEGHGLGLAVAREVIAQHGGRLGWTPRPPGQVFWFELPCLDG
jgi:signal transduction histidine kinase